MTNSLIDMFVGIRFVLGLASAAISFEGFPLLYISYYYQLNTWAVHLVYGQKQLFYHKGAICIYDSGVKAKSHKIMICN